LFYSIKKAPYQKTLENISLLCQEPRSDPFTVLSDAMAFVHKCNEYFYWVGIYLLRGDTLHLGPFSGPITEHLTIPVGRGVCGTAVAERENQVVDDVQLIDNYLSCNLHTRSEVVVLIFDPADSERIIGQIDVDASVRAAFDHDAVLFIEQLALILAPLVKTLLDEPSKN